jgi:hypothetical protein
MASGPRPSTFGGAGGALIVGASEDNKKYMLMRFDERVIILD